MSLLGKMRSRLIRNHRLERLAERQLVLQARACAQRNRTSRRLSGLHDAEFCAYSQWGEDGIIDWLVSQLPFTPTSFVEFGADDYRESNSRLLLPLRNWRGLVIDGSDENIAAIRADDLSWRYDLQAIRAFVTRENINGLISGAGFHGDIGLLSVDIDGNDYWVWEAIDVVTPAIVVCEYNALFGDIQSVTVPYAENFQRTRAHYSNLYFGASIRALIVLAARKGYTCVGTNMHGCNAFFVRNDLAAPIVESLDHRWLFPSRFREGRDASGQLNYASGLARQAAIASMPVVDVRTEEQVILGAFRETLSPEWRADSPVVLNVDDESGL
ncbi:MAG: hypothetical protein NTZ43_02495 [Gemmatimonadetes bacterium]|nr:hypothetical protein [Gemmatimonadota bacterium]